MWEVALRKTPWPEIRFGSEFATRYKRGERPPFPSTNPFHPLLQRCWAQNPTERPEFPYIYEFLDDLEKQNRKHLASQPKPVPVAVAPQPVMTENKMDVIGQYNTEDDM